MKQSWVIGIVTIWTLIFTAELMVTGGTAFTRSSALNTLASPAFVNAAGSTSALSSVINGIGTFFVSFISVIFLWSPTVFAGNWIWFWQFICLPISISFIVVIATILRGVRGS